MLRLYSATLGLSAMLMFVVQPIVSKLVLPVLGGNPSVWNAVVMFFQLMLLLGYGYVYIGRELLGTHKQALLHGGLLIVSLLFLPLSINPEFLSNPVYLQPVFWLVSALLFTVGVPFFTLSANASLLSSWLAGSKDKAAKNPYMLYAASNLGSMIGLLSYPFIVEPFLSLSTQKIVWSVGYVLLVLSVGFCLKTYLHNRNDTQEKKQAKAAKPVPNWRRIHWVLLAFAPSSLMLSVTSYITTDIAPIPLLWVVPLALYLLSFVLVFGGVKMNREGFLPFLLPMLIYIAFGGAYMPKWIFAAAFLVYALVYLAQPKNEAKSPLENLKSLGMAAAFFIPLLLFSVVQTDYLLICLWLVIGFFLVAMVCHGQLQELKPQPAQLTEFYFLLSLGGALGGVFNTLIAPLIFTDFYELHVVLALVFFLLFTWEKQNTPIWKNPTPLAIACACGAAALFFYYGRYKPIWGIDIAVEALAEWAAAQKDTWVDIGFTSKYATMLFIAIAIVSGTAYFFRKQTIALGALCSVILLGSIAMEAYHTSYLFKDRNFFGVLEVKDKGDSISLTNGTTMHGVQMRGSPNVPTSYYSWNGPLGALVRAMREREIGAGQNIAAIGLGAGTVACLAEPQQSVTFFEINPLSNKIANNPDYFTYLRDCAGEHEVVMGDARISMASQPSKHFSLIILDAFNSDAIPIHLITQEALAMYMDKLADNGVIAYHVSNRHMDLKPVVGNLAKTQNLYGLQAYYGGSEWVFLARELKDLGALNENGRFSLVSYDDSKRTWTDDYSNIISILNAWN